MIVTKYDKDRLYDWFFERAILSIKKAISMKDDDFLMLCVGRTGTGKSSLMLHTLELYGQDEASLNSICITREKFADMQYEVGIKQGVRFLGNDEADANKREVMTRWNRDLIKLYLKNRGQNVFHWWNNPSVELFDKTFIEEKIKGLIYISSKDEKRPRTYYYFRTDDLINLYEYAHKNNQKLTLHYLKRNAKRFAYAVGWFKKYNGRFAEEYFNKLKKEGMTAHSLEFKEKYGNKPVQEQQNEMKYTRDIIKNELEITSTTIRKYEIELGFREGIDYIELPGCKKKYTEEAIDKIRKFAESMKKKQDLYKFSAKEGARGTFEPFGATSNN